MKKQKRMMFALLACLFFCGVTLPNPSMAATLERSVIGGGGGRSEAGIYTLEGTIGQAVTGESDTGSSQIRSGFWFGAFGASPFPWILFLPAILSGAAR